MWMEEYDGSRINLARWMRLCAKNADTVCVACPYCMTMFEDGLKTGWQDRPGSGIWRRSLRKASDTESDQTIQSPPAVGRGALCNRVCNKLESVKEFEPEVVAEGAVFDGGFEWYLALKLMFL